MSTEQTERDTHFANFARLLIDEVYANGPQTIQTYELIIARRAYDLMEHILLYAPAAPVPDLAEWPEQEK